MNLVAIKSPPSDLSARLRELADAADRGELTDLVCVYNAAGGYDFLYAASLSACVVMASMLWSNCINRMRE